MTVLQYKLKVGICADGKEEPLSVAIHLLSETSEHRRPCLSNKWTFTTCK